MNTFGSLHYNAIGPWLVNEFGERVIKLSLDGGFTCPNRDGKCGTGGCTFCSDDGSGSFASPADPQSIKDAMQIQIAAQRHKWPNAKYIAYFQNHTNTYAPVEKLRSLWDAALAQDGVVGLAIATRPDCLPADVLDLLEEYNKKTFLWVELGLQTSKESTANAINRCYKNSQFEEAMHNLSSRGIKTVIHLIIGLPGETEEDYINSAMYAASFKPFGIKLHMLHIMEGTVLAATRNNVSGTVHVDPEETWRDLPSLNEYVSTICDILERLPQSITIHRLTGDAPGEKLIAPQWSRNKHTVLNAIQHEFAVRGSYQGCLSF